MNSQENRTEIHYNDLKVIQKIINKYYPKYLDSYDKVISGNEEHMFHIFVIKKDKFNEYCEFILDITFKLEDNL